MEEIIFNLDIKIDSKLSLNSIYANCHWTKRKKDADKMHKLVKYSIIEQLGKPQIFDKPVEIFLYFNTRLDVSNTAYAAKLIEDALKGVLITDDSKIYVKAIHLGIWTKEGVLVKVREYKDYV